MKQEDEPLFSLLKKIELYIDFNLILNGHTVRISEIPFNLHICECLFLLAEIVGDGITTDDVLGNIFNTFIFGESVIQFSSENE